MGIELQFTSVVGRPIGASRTPMSVIAMKSLERMGQREVELRRKNFRRLMTGLMIVAIVLALGVWGLMAIVEGVRAHTPPSLDPNRHPISPMTLATAMSAGLVGFTFLIAAFTRKESRSDVADMVLREGCQSHGGGAAADPLVSLWLTIVMLGILHGQFLVIDAIKTTWVRSRLRGVDRHRAATILAMVLSQPMDVQTHGLLRADESPIRLRQVLAYLIAYEWVDLSRDGKSLRLLSPARRGAAGIRRRLRLGGSETGIADVKSAILGFRFAKAERKRGLPA